MKPSLFLALFGVVTALQASIPEGATSVTCFAERSDRDGDGYAASEATAVRFRAASCPRGYAMGGDCDDAKAAVHPFNSETPFNDIDDNCNGTADELTFDYQDAAPAPGALRIRVRVNHRETAAARGYLYATVEYAALARPEQTTIGPKQIASLSASPPDYFHVEATGLAENEVYRARVQLYDAAGAKIHAPSDWYYGATGGGAPLDAIRARAVTKALFEWDESERGLTGYRGSVDVDGTRYGARPGEWWCSEFYSWVTNPWLDGIAGLSDVGGLLGYFRRHSQQHSGSAIATTARFGDYLAMDTDGNGDLNHSGMFLAYETASDGNFLWTVEGNWGNKTRIKRRELVSRNFRLGHLAESMAR